MMKFFVILLITIQNHNHKVTRGNNNNDSNGSNDEAAGSNDNVFDEFKIDSDISKLFKSLELQAALISIKVREISYIWRRRTSNSAEEFPVCKIPLQNQRRVHYYL